MTSIDGHAQLEQTCRRGAQLAAWLNTDLIVGVCETSSLQPTGNGVAEDSLRRYATSLHARVVRSTSQGIDAWTIGLIDQYLPAWVCTPKDDPVTGRGFHRSPIKRLIEACSTPLWLVGESEQRQSVVLAAVDPTHEHDKSARLDRSILEQSARLASFLDAELHVVHAVFAFDLPRNLLEDARTRRRNIVDQLVYPFGISAHHVHMSIGPPDLEIARMAAELSPEVIVMGVVKRGIWRQITMGSTARAVVGTLSCDLVALTSTT